MFSENERCYSEHKPPCPEYDRSYSKHGGLFPENGQGFLKHHPSHPEHGGWFPEHGGSWSEYRNRPLDLRVAKISEGGRESTLRGTRGVC